jgi:hypothetical protein
VTSVISPEKVLVRACNLAPHREPQTASATPAEAVSFFGVLQGLPVRVLIVPT